MGLGIAIAVGGEPDAELSAASRVEVEERMGAPARFRLHFPLDVAEGDLPLLADGRLDPDSRISVLVPVEGGTECLVQGPVTGQRILLAHGGEGSTLVVEGADSSIVMDRQSRAAVWADLSDSDAVTSILGTYGYTPDVEATAASHPEAGHSLVQRGSDLAFVRRLARRNGFLFWVTADGDGNETAHFRRPPLDGEPAAELIINLAEPSVRELAIQWDSERPAAVEARQLDLMNKGTVDGGVEESPLPPLGETPLAGLAGGPRSAHLVAPADDAGDLRARAEGLAIEAGFFVQASCRTSLALVGKPLRVHTLANLRGAGSRHSGLYFVVAVRHRIDPVAHAMEIELRRNAWGANGGSGALGAFG